MVPAVLYCTVQMYSMSVVQYSTALSTVLYCTSGTVETGDWRRRGVMFAPSGKTARWNVLRSGSLVGTRYLPIMLVCGDCAMRRYLVTAANVVLRLL